MNVDQIVEDGFAVPYSDVPKIEDVVAEARAAVAETTGTATHTGAGWYELDPALADGTDRVRGKNNIPDGYSVTED